MRLPLRAVWMVVYIAWPLLLASVRPLGLAMHQREQPVPGAAWLELVNETRLNEGLDPYGRSRLLSKAAQRHADDLAENGLADADDADRDSDDVAALTDEEERIEEAGYAAWTVDGEAVVAESVWSGRGAPQDALVSLLEDQPHRDNLLSDAFREIGIGLATDAEGRNIYVLDFGARPNVLPIFINDGAASTENREVAIRLTNERVRPGGEGTSFMGEAIEIRISNEPSFEELAWQPWARLVSWVLPDAPGERTVYVQFRDAAGRTAASADGIVLDMGTPATATATPSTLTAIPQATDTAVPPSPAAESSATPGATSETQLEPRGTASPTAASPPGPSATPSVALVARATPFPTWTPLPTPAPTPADLDDPDEVVLSLPDMAGYGRPLAVAGILQGVAIVLGLYWMIRRGKGG